MGEIALLTPGTKRGATVRAVGRCELLSLDRSAFLKLDKGTLGTIADNAKFNTAWAKDPEKRTRDDIDILVGRISQVLLNSKIPPEVHREVCRVMTYKKVAMGHEVVNPTREAASMYIVAQVPQGPPRKAQRPHHERPRPRQGETLSPRSLHALNSSVCVPLYLTAQGEVAIYNPDGEVLRTLGPGEPSGWMAQ